MQVKTKGIVLHQVKYSDSSNIVNIYTQQFGRMTLMVRGVNKKKSTLRTALLQPLSVVEIDFMYHPKNNMHHLREIRVVQPFFDIPFNPVKGSLAMFLVEILHKVLHHSEQDEYLYDFLEKSMFDLDNCQKGLGNFHLYFLMQLSNYLGFFPNTDEMESCKIFDLQNGIFLPYIPTHSQFLKNENAKDFKILLNLELENLEILSLSKTRRSELLDAVVEYYKLHIPDFRTVNSLEVLHNLWN